jgi:hypothetical protein
MLAVIDAELPDFIKGGVCFDQLSDFQEMFAATKFVT